MKKRFVMQLKRMILLIGIPLCVLIRASFVLAEKDPLTIGVLVSLTGNWAQIGETERRALTLASEEVNSSGGILGRPLRFDFQDTREEVSGAQVVSAYRNLREKGIQLFIGPTGVPGEGALVPIAKNDDVLVITSNTGPQIQSYSDNLFNAAGTNEQTTRAAARLAIKNGVKRAAVFGSLQPWEADQAKYFAEEFKKQGGEVTITVLPQPTETDLRVEALKVIKSKPDGVFFATFNQMALAARALKALDFRGQKYAALVDMGHLTSSNGGLEGTIIYLFKPPSIDFKKKYMEKFSEEPGYPADFTYDAVMAFAEAARSAKSVNPNDLKKALLQIEFKGSNGETMRFESSRLIKREVSPVVVKEGKIIEFSE